METRTIEYKYLQKIRTGDTGFRDLSTTCVALANAQGGHIFIGYDDRTRQPLPNQRIDISETNNAIAKLRSLCFNVSLSASEVTHDGNGSQYFIITVSPSISSIASTSDGKYYIRIADKSEPIRSEDMLLLANEKHACQWKSDRVSDHIKQMSNSSGHRPEKRNSPNKQRRQKIW